MVKEQIKIFLSTYSSRLKGQGILVGCSGGPDSMALVHLLQYWSKVYDFNVGVVHIEHGIRGEISKAEAKFVRDYCAKSGLAYYEKTVDVPLLAKELNKSLELVAREVRYDFMAEILHQGNYAYLATGHHLDDQGETILMHLLRGAGPDGLRGILPFGKRVVGNRSITLIRPLLGIRKKDLVEYCHANQLEYCQDMSNYSKDYTRNKIRWELLPLLSQYNPQIVKNLANLGTIMAEQMDYLKYSIDTIWHDLLVEIEKEYIAISLAGLQEQHPFMRKNIYRYCYEKLHGSLQDLTFIHIDILEEFLYNGSVGKVIELPNGIKVKKGYKEIFFGYFKAENNNPIHELIIPLAKLQQDDILQYKFGPKCISMTICAGNSSQKGSKNEVYIPLSSLDGDLVIRQRRDGDRIELPKLGNKKVKELLINAKIPREKRAEIPIITDKKGLIWVAGIRCSSRCQISDEMLLNIKIN